MPTGTTLNPATEAARVRDEFWLPGREEAPYPVDPVRIAKAIGLEVLEATLDPLVSGALVKEPDRDATILLAAGESKRRQRFTCAHELGHFMLRRADADAEAYSYVDRRDPTSSSGEDEVEVWANAFAAELLMPETTVREWFDQRMDDLQMAVRFGVSPQAMNARLRSLGII